MACLKSASFDEKNVLGNERRASEGGTVSYTVFYRPDSRLQMSQKIIIKQSFIFATSQDRRKIPTRASGARRSLSGKAKVTTNSTTSETVFLTNSVASATGSF